MNHVVDNPLKVASESKFVNWLLHVQMLLYCDREEALISAALQSIDGLPIMPLQKHDPLIPYEVFEKKS